MPPREGQRSASYGPAVLSSSSSQRAGPLTPRGSQQQSAQPKVNGVSVIVDHRRPSPRTRAIVDDSQGSPPMNVHRVEKKKEKVKVKD